MLLKKEKKTKGISQDSDRETLEIFKQEKLIAQKNMHR